MCREVTPFRMAVACTCAVEIIEIGQSACLVIIVCGGSAQPINGHGFEPVQCIIAVRDFPVAGISELNVGFCSSTLPTWLSVSLLKQGSRVCLNASPVRSQPAHQAGQCGCTGSPSRFHYFRYFACFVKVLYHNGNIYQEIASKKNQVFYCSEGTLVKYAQLKT